MEHGSVPAGAGCIGELAPNVSGNDGQGRDPAQRFNSRNEAHSATLASRAGARKPPVGLDNRRAGRQRLAGFYCFAAHPPMHPHRGWRTSALRLLAGSGLGQRERHARTVKQDRADFIHRGRIDPAQVARG